MRAKYPRTPHVPWSPGCTSDDKIMDPQDLYGLCQGEVVISLKMDGENTTVYRDGYTHARSIDSNNHPSRDWMKRFASQWAWAIPERMRVCGENLYARHSIRYDDLPSYFLAFGMMQDDWVIGWDWFGHHLQEISLDSGVEVEGVRQVYRGIPGSEKNLEIIMAGLMAQYPNHEGLVARNTQGFLIGDFHKNVCKWVRPNHVQTDQHWTSGPVVPNTLKEN